MAAGEDVQAVFANCTFDGNGHAPCKGLHDTRVSRPSMKVLSWMLSWIAFSTEDYACCCQHYTQPPAMWDGEETRVAAVTAEALVHTSNTSSEVPDTVIVALYSSSMLDIVFVSVFLVLECFD